MEYGHVSSDGGRGVVYENGFVSCPECGGDAKLHIWGEGVDATFECTEDDCGVSEQIR